MNVITEKYIFYIQGMNCRSCAASIEAKIKSHPNVTNACSTFETSTLNVETNFEGKTADEIAETLTSLIIANGYSLSTPEGRKRKVINEFKYAIPIAFVIISIFIVLQKVGFINLIKNGNLSYGSILLIGIIASLSSCMAVVGGLLLSMSATFARGGSSKKPQAYFHLGRFASFFFFGGLIGALGSIFQLSAKSNLILGIAVGLVMFTLGLNLLDIFSGVKKIQPKMPRFLSERTRFISGLNHSLTPVLVGASTFFLPCGFTQAMQIYTLSTGNYLSGALTMSAFALGTFPILALISFGSVNINRKSWKGTFFKVAGILVILFGIFNILSSLAGYGIISPLFNI